jgi:hypothetical protein
MQNLRKVIGKVFSLAPLSSQPDYYRDARLEMLCKS